MDADNSALSETIQKMAARLIARAPAGVGLCLIGGYRYRLLDEGCRRSLDLDYHWGGDLAAKQFEIEGLLRARLLPELRRRLGYEGDVRRATGPDAESAMVKTIEIAAYRTGVAGSRIEVPVDITSVPCLDRPVMKTVDGVGYLSVSDVDMVESKVLALFLRHRVEARDMVDVYFFSSAFLPDSAGRLREKAERCGLREAAVREDLRAMVAGREKHVRAIRGVLGDQVDPSVVQQVELAGGPAMVFDAVMDRLRALIDPWRAGESA
jgi:hypothetical protein